MPHLISHHTRKGRGDLLLKIIFPIIGGVLIAGVSALLLGNFKPIWVILIFAGGLAFIPALIVKDSMVYWLVLFLFLLPFNISKRLLSEETIFNIIDKWGVPWGNFTLSLELTDIPLLVLFGLWFVRIITRKQSIYWPTINYLPLAFLGWITLGTLLSTFPLLSFFELLRQYKYFFIYLFTSNNIDLKKSGKVIIVMLLLGYVIQGGVTIIKYKSQDVSNFLGTTFGRSEMIGEIPGKVTSSDPDEKRGIGFMGHANTTAMYIELVFPLAIVLLLSRFKFKNLFLVLLGIISLYVTFSRGGVGGALAGIIVCVFVACYRGLISKKLVMVILLVGVLLLPLVIPELYSFFTTRPEYLEERFGHWNIGTSLIQISPIKGTGLNTSTAMRQIYTFEGQQIQDYDSPIHNYYLIILIETGIIGAVLYFSFFVLIWTKAFRLSRTDDFFTLIFSIFILAAYVSIATHLIVDFLHFDALHTLLWFYAGLIISLRRSESTPGSGIPHPQTAVTPLSN